MFTIRCFMMICHEEIVSVAWGAVHKLLQQFGGGGGCKMLMVADGRGAFWNADISIFFLNTIFN